MESRMRLLAKKRLVAYLFFILSFNTQATNTLNNTQPQPPSTATIRVSGAPIRLFPAISTVFPNSKSLTITNTSATVTAHAISASLPPGWADVTQDSSACDHLSPGASCAISFTPGSAEHEATPILIAGVNTNDLHANLAVRLPWQSNGDVYAFAVDPVQHRIYLGGDFTFIGPNTGHGVPILTATGRPTSLFPHVNGTINVAISDRSGGWYVGGDFSNIGGIERNHIAHISANGTVDPVFNPSANNTVQAMVLSQDGNTLFAGGLFTRIGEQSRNRLAAIHTNTGDPSPWNPNADSIVRTLALSQDGETLYVGGLFTHINSEARNHLAAIQAHTGEIFSWKPSAEGGSVWTVALSQDGHTLYVGGEFSRIGTETRKYLAAIHTDTGQPTSWNPNADSYVRALALSQDGKTLYAGGFFTCIGTEVRNHLAAIHTDTGQPSSWHPNASGGSVRALALSQDGSTLYAGGFFTRIGEQIRHRLAAIDTDTGKPSIWNPSASYGVSTIALNQSNDTLYAGGDFTSINAENRNRLAAINTETGKASSWNPNANHIVRTLALSPDGSTLYAGGLFTQIKDKPHNRLAAIDTNTGDLLSWSPSVRGGSVRTLALSKDSEILFAGGAFSNINGQTRNHLAAINTGTGNLISWDPNADSIVRALTLSQDGKALFAGGNFTHIGGQRHHRLAAIDTGSGQPFTWNPSANDVVRTLTLSQDDAILYAGGDFTRMNAKPRNHLAAIHTNTGELTPWNPSAGGGSVWALTLSPYSKTLYVAGRFSNISTEKRNRLAAIHTETGKPTLWNPNVYGGYVWTLAVSEEDKTIYTGGAFTQVGNQHLSRFAILPK